MGLCGTMVWCLAGILNVWPQKSNLRAFPFIKSTDATLSLNLTIVDVNVFVSGSKTKFHSIPNHLVGLFIHFHLQ